MSRLTRALAGVLVALLTGGCATTGTAVINANETVTLDLTQTLPNDDAGLTCTALWSGLQGVDYAVDVTATGSTCRVRGTTTFTGLSERGAVGLQHVGGSWILSGRPFPNGDGDTVDVLVTMPGPITAQAGGEVSGNTVRYVASAAGGPLPTAWVVAHDSWTPDPRLLYATGGVLVGGAAAALAWSVLGRRGVRAPLRVPPTVAPLGGSPTEAGGVQTRPSRPERHLTPQDPAVWAPRAGEDT